MKLQIRKGLFETNSSSVHTLTLCMKEEFDDFKNGDMLWDTWYENLCAPACAAKENDNDNDDNDNKRFLTYEEYEEYYGENCGHELFEELHKTPSGETVVAFGFFGHD